MEHGTRSMYCNGACRCLPCTQANSDYDWTYRNGKKQWVNSIEDPLTKSETAIEREKQSRQAEKEIEQRLVEPNEVEDFERESYLSSLASSLAVKFGRRGNKRMNWSCPVGGVRSF